MAIEKVESCRCAVGRLQAIFDRGKVTLLWTLRILYVTDFQRMTSPWGYAYEGQYRLYIACDDEEIYIALMTQQPSNVEYAIRMGILTSESEEKFIVRKQVPPNASFQKSRLCTLSDLRRYRVDNDNVQIFCEINQRVGRTLDSLEENKTISIGTSTLDHQEKDEVSLYSVVMGAKPKENHNTRQKEIFGETIQTYANAPTIARKDAEKTKKTQEAGTSTAEFEEKVEDWSRKSTGAKPKVKNTVPKESYRAEVVQTTDAAGIESGSDEFETADEPGELKNEGSSDVRVGGRSLVREMRKILREGYRADLTFVLKDGEVVAHEANLWAGLPYFSSMLKNMKNRTIRYSDCTLRGFGAFLDYAYTGTLEMLSSSNVWDVFSIAEKFGDEVLKSGCVDKMKNSINLDNFISVMELLLRYNSEELQKAAYSFFVLNKGRITHARGFRQFNEEHPKILNEFLLRDLRY